MDEYLVLGIPDGVQLQGGIDKFLFYNVSKLDTGEAVNLGYPSHSSDETYGRML